MTGCACEAEVRYDGVCLRCTLARVQRFAVWLHLTEHEPEHRPRRPSDCSWSGA